MLVRATYMYGVVLHAHPVRGESHNQRNTTGEVATLVSPMVSNENSYFTMACRAFLRLNLQWYHILIILLAITA